MWSISETWFWFIHVPYLGLIILGAAALLAMLVATVIWNAIEGYYRR